MQLKNFRIFHGVLGEQPHDWVIIVLVGALRPRLAQPTWMQSHIHYPQTILSNSSTIGCSHAIAGAS